MKISPQVAMTLRQIMLMNFGFFGIQYSFGLQQTPDFQLPSCRPEPIADFEYGRPDYRFAGAADDWCDE